MDFKDEYTSFQTGARRFQEVMRGTPDCVPVYAQIHEFTIHQLGLNPRQFYTTPELLVPASLDTAESYGMDIGCIDYDVYNIEAEALGQAMLYFNDRSPRSIIPLHSSRMSMICKKSPHPISILTGVVQRS